MGEEEKPEQLSQAQLDHVADAIASTPNGISVAAWVAARLHDLGDYDAERFVDRAGL